MSIVNQALPAAKKVARTARNKIMGVLPPPVGRLTGALAIHGGRPVRDTRFRPWPAFPQHGALEWARTVAPVLRHLFMTGEEGTPAPLAKEFSRQWAEYCGSRYALLLPHGTDALRIALAAALDHDGLEYGGEVIVPNISFIASANAALDRRFGVALVDVEPGSLTLDSARVEEAIIPGKTRAIMPVHLFGHPANMAELREIADRHSVILIEDAAQAHGAEHELGRVGSLGTAGAFSFQGSKNLPSGEGGALTTNDEDLFLRATAIHDVGRSTSNRQRWAHESLGWNCRPTEYVAAVLLSRLGDLEAQQNLRHSNFLALHEAMRDVNCVEPLVMAPWVHRHGAHLFAMRYLSERCGGLSIEDFIRAANAEGAPIGRVYNGITMSQQPALQAIAARRPDYLRVLPTPVADEAVKQLLFLNHNVFLGSEQDMEEIAAAIRKVERHFAPSQVEKERGKPKSGKPLSVSCPQESGAQPPEPAIRPTRIGVIGSGVMGSLHAGVIDDGPSTLLVGVADARPEVAEQMAQRFKCRYYASAQELIESGRVDTVVIATPHWQHADLAILALFSGLNVICEKPLAVTVSQADRALEVARRSRGTFAVVHQTRLDPLYRTVKELLESGDLGQIYRCEMVEAQSRTAAYYRSAPWRGTWDGEGGGVLINQAPHVLDRYVWLCGMPESVVSWCNTTAHSIEVEDAASAILRHKSGCHGLIHVNTVESPAVSRIGIYCDRGRIEIRGRTLTVTRLKESVKDGIYSQAGVSAEIASETRETVFDTPPITWPLSKFYDNFVRVLAGQDALVAPAEAGRDAVELANAIILSSHLSAAVRLPLDRQQYDHLMNKLTGRILDGEMESSSPERPTMEATA